jgi:isocitrate dehydrogenase (NAD+)
VFEAVHGTAPDIAGQGIANPTAIIQSSVMMLRHLGEESAADRIHGALFRQYAEAKVLTGDIGGSANTMTFTAELCRLIRG